MDIAKPTDWETFPLPANRIAIPLDRRFSKEEMERIRRGAVPEVMEDKWFVYWQEDRLYFHRSWTGRCIYVVRFEEEEDGFRMVEAYVNGDREEYNKSDFSDEPARISYLIDVLLLRIPSKYPTTITDEVEQFLNNWVQVGRAMFGDSSRSE